MLHQHHHHHGRRNHQDNGHHGHILQPALQPPQQQQAPPNQVAQDSSSGGVATLVSLVFVTASQTFPGEIGGYVTVSPQSVASTPAPVQPVQSQSVAQQISSALDSAPAAETSFISVLSGDTFSNTPILPVHPTVFGQSTTIALPISVLTTFKPTTLIPSPVLASIPLVSSSSVLVAGASADPASATTPATAATNSSSGLSGGAIAGTVFGVILGLIALSALGMILYRKRWNRRGADEHVEDEKNPFGNDAAAQFPFVSTPPHLNLRSNTQFGPEQIIATASGISVIQSQDLEKAQPLTGELENPFGKDAEILNINQEVPAPLKIRAPSPEGTVLAIGADLIGAGTIAGAATLAQRHNAPKPLNIKPSTSPIPRTPIDKPMPSPAGTEFSINSVSTSTMANATVPTNVHRIQLDFKPSMEDELELRAGQLVRLLHEYDDGWALCIRLDRSQQGVAPRTCLSTRPVKPRAKGSPRPGPPPGMRLPVQPLGSSATSERSYFPRSLAPRSMSSSPLQGQRSMSPGPYGGGPQCPNIPPPGSKRRSNSASDVRAVGRNGPLGPSPMNPNSLAQPETPPILQPPWSSQSMQRKPVAGQIV